MFESGGAASFRRPLLFGVLIGILTMVDAEGGESPEFTPDERAAQGVRVDIAEGSIEPKQFFRFLAEFTGVAVIVDSESTPWLEKPITLVAPITGADDEVVMRLLEANGWRARKTTLPDGREVLSMSHEGAKPADASRVARRSTASSGGRRLSRSRGAATPGQRSSRTAAPTGSEATSDSHGGPIFELGAGGLMAIEGRVESLLEQGVTPDDRCTVVVPLVLLEAKDVASTVLEVVFPRGRNPDELVVVPVRGAHEVILAGKASRVDYALRLLQTLDDFRSAERVTATIKVQHADVVALATLINKIWSPCSPCRRAPLSATGDARTGTLIVEAVDPGDIERVRGFVREADAKPPTPRQKTRIYQVRHAKAIDLAEKLGATYGSVGTVLPHQATNSLLIQANSEDCNEILNVLTQLDVPPRGNHLRSRGRCHIQGTVRTNSSD